MELSQLSDKQKIAFDQFKEAVKDCTLFDTSDEYKLKWLIARNFNPDHAEQMLRRSLDWRLANQIDGIVDQWEPPAVLRKYYPMTICGKDKFSCPVWINVFGQTDWKGILQSVSKSDYLRYICYLAEMNLAEMRKNSNATGRPVTNQTFIIDMEHLSMNQMAYKPVREVGIEATKMSEENYPESLRKVFVINAPKIFTAVFAIIKPFLHQATIDKIRVFSTDKAAWSAALLQEIDADQLPVHYGGTMIGAGGNLYGNVNMGQVPESYYLKSAKPHATDAMTCIHISRASKKKIELKIVKRNSVLSWEFTTEGGDIGFEIYQVDRNGMKISVKQYERIQSHLKVEEGKTICKDCCTYVVEFDNSYSLLRSKKVLHCIRLNPSTR